MYLVTCINFFVFTSVKLEFKCFNRWKHNICCTIIYISRKNQLYNNKAFIINKNDFTQNELNYTFLKTYTVASSINITNFSPDFLGSLITLLYSSKKTYEKIELCFTEFT